MSRPTIAQKIIDEMVDQGHEFIGKTRGQLSLRKGSNLSKYLEFKGIKAEDVIVRMGARAGVHWNDGYELLVFSAEKVEA